MNRRDTLKLLLAASGSTIISPAFAAGLQPSAPAQPSQAGATPAHSESSSAESTPRSVFTWLTLGEVKPSGWIREQMLRDLKEGFAGHLGELCHEASSDIFVSNRNSAASANTANVEKNNWWNGETEGNWRAGFIMMAYLTGDKPTMDAADAYVRHILSSQDPDGYLGVFASDIRFSRPGELWTQACLMRGLLDYYELTGNQAVRDAVVRAVNLTMSVYGPRKTPIPFEYTISGQGLSHDLMFSDVTERLYDLTGDVKYRDFTVGLYENMSAHTSKADTSLSSLLDLNSDFVDHGANTFEAIRVPLWLSVATGREDFGQASRNALDKINRYTEPSGSDVSQEDILALKPNPSTTEYEYCGTKEMQFTLESALQKTGVASLGDKIELIWFNAAQGSRLPNGSGITYLTSDNRLHCDGLSPDGTKPDIKNKFSPTHTDVAVCCNPNAANVAALYVRGMWMRHNSGALAALLYGPCSVSTTVQNVPVRIEEKTLYPFENLVTLEIHTEGAPEFPLYLRDPGWSRDTIVKCEGATITRENSYWVVRKKWQQGDSVLITFVPTIQEVPAVNGEIALKYGALLFAQPLEAQKTTLKTYSVPGFEDSYYKLSGKYETLTLDAASQWQAFGFKPISATEGVDPLRPFDDALITLQGKMTKQSDGAQIPVTLVPLGNAAILRRVTFPVG
ncbi:MAG TPA: beta-L-arabinofuranosidase domain-containing protein [Silvibacterium sp.]|nr:beta-L-arabinofuranosidase domain-containing protein [Silvibacterium sp.]